MKIHRIEHETLGVGPLCYEGCNIHHLDWTQVAIYHASPDEMTDTKIKRHHKFGMRSERLLNMLFKGSIDRLKEKGFIKVCYEAKDFEQLSDGQVMFDSRTATKVIQS